MTLSAALCKVFSLLLYICINMNEAHFAECSNRAPVLIQEKSPGISGLFYYYWWWCRLLCPSLVEVTKELFLTHCVMMRLETTVIRKAKGKDYVQFCCFHSPRSANSGANTTINYSSSSFPAYYCNDNDGVWFCFSIQWTFCHSVYGFAQHINIFYI